MKRFYLKENLKTYSEFTSLNEEINIENQQETSISGQDIEGDVITGDNLSGEIDTILDKLKELEDGIEEELAVKYLGLIEDRDLFEEEDGAMAKIKDFVFVAPKVTKMQKKANKIRLNKEVLDMTVQNPEIDGKKKKSLEQKRDGLKDQLKDLENAVTQYQKDNGGKYSARKLAKTKIEGQLAAIKKKTGMSDDPKQQKSLAQDAKELAVRYKEEVAATKEIADADKPSPEEVAKAKADEIKTQRKELIDKKESTDDKKAQATLQVEIETLNVKIAALEKEGEAEAKQDLKDAKAKLAEIESGGAEAEAGAEGEAGAKGYNESEFDGSGRSLPIAE